MLVKLVQKTSYISRAIFLFSSLERDKQSRMTGNCAFSQNNKKCFQRKQTGIRGVSEDEKYILL